MNCRVRWCRTQLFVLSKHEPTEQGGMYYRLVDGKNCADKEQLFLSHINGNVDGNRIYYPNVEQMNFENIPGAPIGYWCSKKFIYNFSATPCSKIADFKSGMSTTDNERFLRSWYEVNFFNIGFK